jgi:hypothetical protein
MIFKQAKVSAEPIAQWLEQATHTRVVEGSNSSGLILDRFQNPTQKLRNLSTCTSFLKTSRMVFLSN